MNAESEDSHPYSHLLGADPELSKSTGAPISPELVTRWTNYLTIGLEKGEREQLLEKWLIPENCLALGAPKLNPELQHLLKENETKSDAFITRCQNDLGIGLSALGSALGQLLNSESQSPVEDVITVVADAAKMFCNVHNLLSVHRRYKIHPKLDPAIQKTAKDCIIDSFLFGKDFAEQCKIAQAVKRTSVELKAKPTYSFKKNLASSSRDYLNSERYLPRSRFKKRPIQVNVRQKLPMKGNYREGKKAREENHHRRR